jgi:hypothetical protein
VWFFDAFRLAKAVTRLEERLIALERAWNAVESEWTDQLDRYRRLHGRIAKRAALIAADDQRQEIEDGAPGHEHSAADGPASGSLSPAQRRLNEQILARRARLPGGPR